MMTDVACKESNHNALPRLEELNSTVLEILYDHQLDTLFVHLLGHDQRATNPLTGEYACYRVDPNTQRVVGLQIESFLRRAVNDHPELIGLLRFAQLRGASFDQVQRESTNAFPVPMQWLLRMRTGLGLMLRSSAEQPARHAIAALRLYAPRDGAATS
jgi:hypothetical protein